MNNDYYAILGVPKDASTEEIKRAYRKIARAHHPDVNGGNGDDEQFKAATRAYEVLSNSEKRRQYDLGFDPTRASGANPFGAQGFGFQDIFETFFGAAGPAARGPESRSRRGQDALLRVEVELIDAVFGAEREVTVDTAVTCSVCHGSCAQPGTEPTTCTTCHGSGSVQRVAQSLFGQVMTSAPCPSCRGFGTIITNPCVECSGEGRVRARRTLTINVPAGVETGTRIRMSGQGEAGPAGGPPGDLYIDVRVKQHDVFTRDGDDLHVRLVVPMTAAALGTVTELETFDGPQQIDIAPGTQPESVVKLRGLGVGRLQRSGRGDLHVHVEVETPTALDTEQQELLTRLAELRGETRPEARLVAPGGGFFKRMRDKLAGK